MIRDVLRENFKLIDKNEEISNIFGYLYEDRFFPIIMDGKKPWGIVDIRLLLKRKLSINWIWITICIWCIRTVSYTHLTLPTN